MKSLFALILLSSSLFSQEVTFVLIRHGETDWNAQSLVQGHTDIPLNEKGIAQAEITAEKLLKRHPDIQAIYSSDLSRAYATAQKTAEKLHLPIAIRPGLRENAKGESEGMKMSDKIALYRAEWDELDRKYPEMRERWKYTPIPGEETITDLIERISRELTQIARTHLGEKVAIFSHGKAIQTLLMDIENKSLGEVSIPNCAIVEVVYDSENPAQPFKFNGIISE